MQLTRNFNKGIRFLLCVIDIYSKYAWIVKNTVPWTYAISDLNGEEIIGTFYEKELQKANQQKFRIQKVIKKKSDMSNGHEKVMIIHLIAELIKNT